MQSSYRTGLLVAALSIAVAACGGKKEEGGEAAAAKAPAAEEKVLNVYNWSDYIAEDTIANFEQQTGIKVNYDVFDSNEVLETKLLAGKTGYDVVVPSASFLERQATTRRRSRRPWASTRSTAGRSSSTRKMPRSSRTAVWSCWTRRWRCSTPR
jgi:spermidine/putrescine-binding protein